ncbi:MAG: cupin-like domain-containing protein, partial [Pirellulaceae bacterium]
FQNPRFRIPVIVMAISDLINANFTARELEAKAVITNHRLCETNLFDDEHLIRILDTHPRHNLNVHTMGTDEATLDWREGDASKLSGEQLLAATRQGRLWLNIRNMILHHREYANLINGMYDEIEAKVPYFKAVERSANLLVSSPAAIVYYHLDIPCNMLWHLRGIKRVWAYPPHDERFVSQVMLEDVICGDKYEEIPYDPSFDEHALVHDLKPGEMITWPQNAPHRVSNLEGLNVSLTTEHLTPQAQRKIKLYRANRFFRQRFGCQQLSTDIHGIACATKLASYKLVRAWQKLFPAKVEDYEYPKTFELDPTSPAEVRELAARS